MSGRKASLSLNPLSSPTSSIQALAIEFQAFMHFPDPAPLYAVMGAVAANMLSGNPVWLMLIGPPSCGKTTLLETLMKIPRTHAVSSISGEAALLSAVAKRDRTASATGGLLRQIGSNGGLVLKDFTSMMSMNRDALDKIMAALREIYDGRWDRATGSEGGRAMLWEGKLALLSGCTQVIDRHHQIAGEMGERWVFFRYPDSDGFGEIQKAIYQPEAAPKEAKARMQELVRCFFDALGLEWGGEVPKRQLNLREARRIAAIATFAARARSGIPRNKYTREVEDSPQYEAPTRLASVLSQTYLGMELIGVEEPERWRVAGKMAGDCMPQVRAKAIERVQSGWQAGKGGSDVESTYEEILETLQCSRSTVNRVLEDLEILKVVHRTNGKRAWVLSDWAKSELDLGWGSHNGNHS